MHRLLIIGFGCYTILPAVQALDFNDAITTTIRKYARSEPRLIQLFSQSKLSYPPKDIALLAFKEERKIELWAQSLNRSWRYIHTYPLTAYSGHLGPKLRELDRQIPEGIYKIVAFNPFSSMHLSLKLNYPNNFDKLYGSIDGRRNLGNDIFLHGKSQSVGCLAVGDRAIEQLFLLTHRVGLEHVKVIIAPHDLRKKKPRILNKVTQPRWVPKLYMKLKTCLSEFRVAQS